MPKKNLGNCRSKFSKRLSNFHWFWPRICLRFAKTIPNFCLTMFENNCIWPKFSWAKFLPKCYIWSFENYLPDISQLLLDFIICDVSCVWYSVLQLNFTKSKCSTRPTNSIWRLSVSNYSPWSYWRQRMANTPLMAWTITQPRLSVRQQRFKCRSASC